MATSAAARAITTSSRPLRPGPKPWEGSDMPEGTGTPNASGIGASVKRKEDFRFLTGRGTYTDDINRPGQTYASILRSPHATAYIVKIDPAKAAKAPGVVAILTGADYDKGGLPCGWQIHSKDGSPMIEPPHFPLCKDKVRHVGDQVALVVAETYDQAKDAAELIDVTYNETKPVISLADADKPGQPQVWADAKNNTCFDWQIGDKAAT